MTNPHMFVYKYMFINSHIFGHNTNSLYYTFIMHAYISSIFFQILFILKIKEKRN